MKTRMLCPGCGSADVTRDGSLRWNGEDWEKSGECDHMACNDCCRDERVLDEIPDVAPVDVASAALEQIKVRIYNGLTEDLWLSEFFAATADGIDAKERAAILNALAVEGTYKGGGGAEPEWRLWVIGVEEKAT